MEQPSTFSPSICRRCIAAFACVAIVLTGLLAIIYWQEHRHQQAILEREASYVVSLEKEFLTQEFFSVQTDLLYLARQATLSRFLDGHESSRQSVETEYARFAESKGTYDQIRILDVLGQEIVRVNYDGTSRAEVVPRDQLQMKALRYYYQEALALDQGEIFVSPFDLNVEHERVEMPIKPVVRFLTPVFSTSGEKRGLLVLNYLGAHLLGKFKEISTGFRGETMLINGEGEYLQAPQASHAWGWMRDHRQSFRRHFPEAWARGRDADQEQFRIAGDLFTFERVSPISLPQWSTPQRTVSRRTPNSLLVVSRISRSVSNEPAQHLLAKLRWLYVGSLGLVFVLTLYWARSSGIREYQEWRLAESEKRLRQLSSRLLAAQEEERRDLSRTLHDELGQQVTAIALDMKSIARDAPESPSIGRVQKAIEQTERLLQSLHEIASRVRPSVLDDLGLHDAIESYVEEYQQRTGIHVHCDLQLDRPDHVGDDVPATIGENVYRICQEALANVANHAHTDNVWVRMAKTGQTLFLEVVDRGQGFDPAHVKRSSRLGLLGMRERVELLNGQFELVSQPGEGTVVRVTIPLP